MSKLIPKSFSVGNVEDVLNGIEEMIYSRTEMIHPPHPHKPPSDPRRVRLRLYYHHYPRRKTMLDATLSWQASATGAPTVYIVVWTYNGTAQPPQSVPATTAQNASGYSLGFAASNPSITVAPGDVIGATVQADDVPDSLVSAVVPSVPPSVTEPTPPPPPPVTPGPPQNVTLTLS